MELNRDNFDIWLTRWLSGSLNEDQADKFMAFLLDNPDIMQPDDLSYARLSPETHPYPHKDRLRKNPLQLNTEQIEYLSAAFHENDLSPEAIHELELNIDNNAHYRKIFELTGKARLVAPDIHYPDKKSLKRVGPTGKIFRLATEIISIAAVILIVLMFRLMAPGSMSDQGNTHTSEILPEHENMPEYTIYRMDPIAIAEPVQATSMPASRKTVAEIISPPVSEPSDLILAQTDVAQLNDLTVPAEAAFLPAVTITKIDISLFSGNLEFNTRPAWLIASSTDYRPEYFYDDRGRVRRFFASTFREKILKEEGEPWKPLLPYEIARAGVDGLNRLLDWYMELKETKSSQGETKSVYFSSMLLTFNAPVKKTGE